MACLDNDLIAALLDGALDEQQRSAVDAHLDQCPSCRRLLSQVACVLSAAAPATAAVATPPARTVVESSDSGGGIHIGTTVGNFIVTEFLAAGSMGAVYLGRHRLLCHRVAIKVMRSELLEGRLADESVQRFINEAKALTEIKDLSHIVQLFDFGVLADGSLYYVMEHLQGQTLARHLKGRLPLGAEQALPYLRQICDGLEAAHSCRIVHRDLKPSNIFVLQSAPLRLKILDFGLAKRFSTAHALTGGGLGSPLYAAPELVLGEQDRIGTRSDIFALGVIAYEMLTGEYPYELPRGITARALFMLPTQSRPIPLRERTVDVDPRLADLVDQCLRPNPEDRPASARAFRAALERAVCCGPHSGRPDRPMPGSRARPTPGEGRRARRVATLGLTGLLLLGCVMVLSHYGPVTIGTPRSVDPKVSVAPSPPTQAPQPSATPGPASASAGISKDAPVAAAERSIRRYRTHKHRATSPTRPAAGPTSRPARTAGAPNADSATVGKGAATEFFIGEDLMEY